MTEFSFSRFRVITFDCYGTLIDWESGMLAALRPSFAQRRSDLTDEALLEAQRWLGHDEGLFVEPSSATAVAAALQLREGGVLHADDRVVLVLTSGGLKDPDPLGSRPSLPLVEDDLAALGAALKDVYGLVLD